MEPTDERSSKPAARVRGGVYKESVMKRFVALFGGIAAASLSMAVYAADDGHPGHKHAADDDKPVTIQGELIDTACFVASDGDAKGKDHAACATKCMGSGVPAGILPEGSKDAHGMMYLLTNPVPLAPYAGQTIKVEGTAHVEMHAIDVKKAYVMQGTAWKEIPLSDEHHKMAGSAKPADHDHK